MKAKEYKSKKGISLIVLVITIIVIIILAAAVILTLNKNNPIEEANRARYESDVANMQAIFTNTVAKVMAVNQGTIVVNAGVLNSIKIAENGISSTEGVVNYTVNNPQDISNENGTIIFNTGTNTATTYYTGRMLPLYSAGETKWYVDSEGLISVNINGIPYGEGLQEGEVPPVEEETNEIRIAASDNPMIKRMKFSEFDDSIYQTWIKKIKFTLADKVSKDKTKLTDISQAQDKSVMAWLEVDESNGYVLTIAGKEKIVANTNCYELFAECRGLTEIENLELLDTTQVTNMNRMFGGCDKISSLNLSNFNTSNVTDMISMFESCKNLVSLNLSNFDTTSVTNMWGMFNRCESLTSLDVSSFNTSNVTSMNCMFANCTKLVDLNLGNNFNTGKVTNMGAMFIRCNELVNLNLDNLDTTNVTDFSQMFQEATKLNTTITIKAQTLKCSNMFNNAATDTNAKIVLNYTSISSRYINSLLDTKSSNSNVVKGVQVE